MNQVEPRIPISSACSITQPGSYYLTGDIAATGHGIAIRTNNVTLDLMGFTVSGDRNSNSDYGIYVDGNLGTVRTGVCVRNGSVVAFGDGVRVEFAQNCRFEDLVCQTNRNYGFYVMGDTSGVSSGHLLSRCVAADNGYGFVLGASNSGTCEGNRLVSCAAERNGSYGLLLNGNAGTCRFNEVLSMRVVANGTAISAAGVALIGAYAGHCYGNVLQDCVVTDNAWRGIYLLGTDGDCACNLIQGCIVSGNNEYGIFADATSNTCIMANSVVGNGNGSGIYVTRSSGNLVLNNVGLGSAYTFDANEIYGPVVNVSGALDTSGDAAHPWANFRQ